jgi:hypothetical protein
MQVQLGLRMVSDTMGRYHRLVDRLAVHPDGEEAYGVEEPLELEVR